MNLPRLASLALLSTALVSADDPPPEKSALSCDPATGAWTFAWWGVDARTYFIQYSETLMSWDFLPVIEQGNAAPSRYGLWLSPPPPRFFLRLLHTDQPHGGDPYAFDFSGGGLPAGWALEHGLNPFDPAEAAKPAGAGLTWLELYQHSLGDGADPTAANAAGLVVFTP